MRELQLLSMHATAQNLEKKDVQRSQSIKCLGCRHIETSQLICCTNQLPSFYMRATLALNELIFLQYFQRKCLVDSQHCLFTRSIHCFRFRVIYGNFHIFSVSLLFTFILCVFEKPV